MIFEQKKRYFKIFQEEFYLLNIDKEKIMFSVSGSTANIYDISIIDRKFICNCPDGKIWAKSKKCVCKHVCFLLYKVFKLFTKDNVDKYTFFDTLILSNKDYEKIMISYNNIECTNIEYVEKYKLLLLQNNNIFEQKKITNEDDSCAICFENFIDKKDINVECPTCHNIIHTKCIMKWLNTGKENCVYCRSDVWKYYDQIDYKNLKIL